MRLSKSDILLMALCTSSIVEFRLFLLVLPWDMFELKKQILIVTSLAISALFIGTSFIIPQLILPMTANLSNDEDRRRHQALLWSCGFGKRAMDNILSGNVYCYLVQYCIYVFYNNRFKINV